MNCEECGGLLTWPGLHGCKEGHPAPSQAQRIAMAIEEDLNDRRGLQLSSVDDEVAQEIRETWVTKIEALL